MRYALPSCHNVCCLCRIEPKMLQAYTVSSCKAIFLVLTKQNSHSPPHGVSNRSRTNMLQFVSVLINDNIVFIFVWQGKTKQTKRSHCSKSEESDNGRRQSLQCGSEESGDGRSPFYLPLAWHEHLHHYCSERASFGCRYLRCVSFSSIFHLYGKADQIFIAIVYFFDASVMIIFGPSSHKL